MRIILAAALLCAAQSVIAHESLEFHPDWYVGAGIGQSAVEATVNGFTFDGEGTSWELMMGYQATRNIGFEFGYLATGEAKDILAGVPVSLKADAFDARIVGSIPFPGGFSLHGSIGVVRWDADGDVGGFQTDDSGTDPTFGAGAGFQYEHTLFRLDYQRADIDQFDVELFTFSVLYMI